MSDKIVMELIGKIASKRAENGESGEDITTLFVQLSPDTWAQISDNRTFVADDRYDYAFNSGGFGCIRYADEPNYEMFAEMTDDDFNGLNIVNRFGIEIPYGLCVDAMVAEIRESLHKKMAHCSNQEFFEEYCNQHQYKMGEEFYYDTANAIF